MILCPKKRYEGRKIKNYTIIRRIGQGRYGVCFLAEENNERRILKRIKPRMFKRNMGLNDYEIQILSRLSHPGIPRLLGIIREKDFYGLALEHKCGVTLEQMLFKQKHGFTKSEILNIGLQLIEIIRYLHDKGVVHRDIRIPNVLIHEETVALIDFGLARWEDEYYKRDIDFSFFGDVLIYLLYSTYIKEKRKSRPWYEELPLSREQQLFLKQLLKLAEPYQNIDQIASDFQKAFSDTAGQ